MDGTRRGFFMLCAGPHSIASFAIICATSEEPGLIALQAFAWKDRRIPCSARISTLNPQPSTLNTQILSRRLPRAGAFSAMCEKGEGVGDAAVACCGEVAGLVKD